jgi:hypothetical protein
MVAKVKDSDYTLTLTADEIYTLQILLGFVVCDAECNSIIVKLEDIVEEEMMCEDYDRATFSVVNMDTGAVVSSIENHSVAIRFN